MLVFCEMDRQFLYQLKEELEVKREYKLFIPGRDDPPGSTITAYFMRYHSLAYFMYDTDYR
jgi:hypothetical protein